MATITKRSSGRWKAVVRRKGWPTTIKTFRVKKDAEDWARSVEDEMARGVLQNSSEQTPDLVWRYLLEGLLTKFLKILCLFKDLLVDLISIDWGIAMFG
jgi:hypothetical protein